MGNCCSSPAALENTEVPRGVEPKECLTPEEHKIQKESVDNDESQVRSDSASNLDKSCVGHPEKSKKSIDMWLPPENASSMGYPMPYYETGPPLPPCNDGREDTVKLLSLLDAPPDAEVQNMLELIKNIFQAPSAFVSLFGDRRVFIRNCDGVWCPGDFPWRWSFCAWSMANNNHQTFVVEDAQQDARFRHNAIVVGEPYLRFYVGTPLVASNGHRLGNLCFVDWKPRRFDAASCLILSNLAELVVRRIEKDVSMQLNSESNQALMSAYTQMKRTMDCLDSCIILVDTQAEGGWRLIYANPVFTQLSGVDRDELLGHNVSAIFRSTRGTEVPSERHLKAAAVCKAFLVNSVEVIGGNGARLQLRFRPAGVQPMDADTLPVGVPSFLPASTDVEKSRYFFAAVVPEAQVVSKSIKMSGSSKLSGSSVCSELLSSYYYSNSVEGLDLGHILGQGAYGRVYFGHWMGTPVAVKVMEQCLEQLKDPNGPDLEALLGQEMKHPHIVACLKHNIVTNGSKGGSLSTAGSVFSDDTAFSVNNSRIDSSAPRDSELPPLVEADSEEEEIAQLMASEPSWSVMTRDSPSKKDYVANSAFSMNGCSSMFSNGKKSTVGSEGSSGFRQTVLIMEYCDKGTLQDGIDRGWFRTFPSNVEAGTNFVTVVATASEIAGALAFLHQRGVMHGDLSPYNVMLTSNGATSDMGGRGFLAKIADFGLARCLDLQSRVTTQTYGTLTHMPPETLQEGVVSKSTDVYSFGVLLWQMLTSCRPWAGLAHGQIVTAVCGERRRLNFDPNKEVHPACADLAMDCMAYEVSARPSMDEVCNRLRDILVTLE